MPGPVWKDEEIKLLKILYSEKSLNELELIFQRPLMGIVHKAMELGISKKRAWTRIEDDVVKVYYKDTKVSKQTILSALPGRTWGAVRGRAFILGIKRGDSELYKKIRANGKYGEVIAEEYFKSNNIKVITKGGESKTYDYLIKIQDEVYSINVKYGKAFLITAQNLCNLKEGNKKMGYLLITNELTPFLLLLYIDGCTPSSS